MKKKDLINKIAEAKGTTKKDAGEILDVMIEVLKNAVKEEGEVDLGGFVKLYKVHKDATTARSPKTGEVVSVPAKDVPRAKFSTLFKRELAE